MVALRGFGWPQETSVTRINRPKSSPTDAVAQPSSIEKLIRKAQAVIENRAQRSADIHCPQLPVFRALSPLCTQAQTLMRNVPPTEAEFAAGIRVDTIFGVQYGPSLNGLASLDNSLSEEQPVCRPFSVSYDILGLRREDIKEGGMPPALDSDDLIDMRQDGPSDDAVPPSSASYDRIDIYQAASTEKLVPSTSDSYDMLSIFQNGSYRDSSIPHLDLNLLSPIEECSNDCTSEDQQNISEQFDLQLLDSLEFSSDGARGSFNALVLDLLQDEPDFPIGGFEAAPMALKLSSNSGGSTRSPDTRKSFTRKPVKVSKPSVNTIPRKLPKPVRLPESSVEEVQQREVSNQSISSDELVGTEKRPMFTAPETPTRRRSTEENASPYSSSKTRKSKDAPDTARNDSSWRSSFPVIPIVVVAKNTLPKSKLNKSETLSSVSPRSTENSQGDAAGDPTPQIAEPGDGPAAPAEEQAPMKEISGVPIESDGPEAPDAVEEASPAPKVPVAPQTGAVPGAPMNIPTDVSGQLPAPEIAGVGKGGKGRKIIRVLRSSLLSRPVLILIVGRQLAGPTATALLLISQGAPIDPNDITTAAGVAKPPAGPPIPA